MTITGADNERKPARILLVDDHVLFRKGLSSLLSSQKGVEVVGESGDALEALEKAREIMPDIILMDIKMPGHDGIEATRWIKEEMPHIKIIMLTVSGDEKDLFEAIKSGAQGYLLKNLEPEGLLKMIEEVLRGEAALSPAMATKVLREFSRGGMAQEQVTFPLATSPKGRKRCSVWWPKGPATERSPLASTSARALLATTSTISWRNCTSITGFRPLSMPCAMGLSAKHPRPTNGSKEVSFEEASPLSYSGYRGPAPLRASR